MNKEFSNGYLWYTVAVLTLASTFSIIDRQILNVMIGPVQRDLGGISDFQISLIMGFAFTFMYSILSYPAGWIADRYNRKNLMALGIFSWSVLTMICGTVHQYWHLFLARMGVGVGEATLGPAANSALADYFPADRLPLAIGIMSAAPFIGQGLANIAGGPLIDYLERTPNFVLPWVGELYSWQMVFIVVGAPGILVALATWWLREPPRQGRVNEVGVGVPFSEVWAFVKTRRAFFFFVFTAYLCLATQGWSLFSWIVEYYVRNHAWTRSEIGVVYGSIAMSVGIAGSVIGGLSDGSAKRRDAQNCALWHRSIAGYGAFPHLCSKPLGGCRVDGARDLLHGHASGIDHGHFAGDSTERTARTDGCLLPDCGQFSGVHLRAVVTGLHCRGNL